jgi:hypothetical protein
VRQGPRDQSHPNHIKGKARFLTGANELHVESSNSKNTKAGGLMKKLLLLPLIAIGLALTPMKQADAQVSVGIGPVGFGYPAYGYSYGYPGYGYYPRSYYGYYGGYPNYRTYQYSGRPYYYGSHRYHRHHNRYYRY